VPWRHITATLRGVFTQTKGTRSFTTTALHRLLYTGTTRIALHRPLYTGTRRFTPTSMRRTRRGMLYAALTRRSRPVLSGRAITARRRRRSIYSPPPAAVSALTPRAAPAQCISQWRSQHLEWPAQRPCKPGGAGPVRMQAGRRARRAPAAAETLARRLPQRQTGSAPTPKIFTGSVRGGGPARTLAALAAGLGGPRRRVPRCRVGRAAGSAGPPGA
jgi:hypothetical protein